MREKLKQDIKRKFRHVWGSKKLKEQRQEIITNALDRYDEEIQSGASEAYAYRAAVNSIGNMKELKDSLGLRDKRNFWVTFTIIAVSVLLLAVSAVVGAKSGVWLLFICTLIGSALTGIAIWRLVTGRRRSVAPHIIAIVIGANLLVYPVFFTLILGLQLIEDVRAETHDYTSRYAEVSSVELVEMNKVVIHGDGTNDVFDHTVIKELDRNQWEECLKDCAKLKYSHAVFGDPLFLTEARNQKMIVIHFEENADPCFCVFYGSWDPGYLQGAEDSFMVHYDVTTCDYDEWKTILKKYFDYTP